MADKRDIKSAWYFIPFMSPILLAMKEFYLVAVVLSFVVLILLTKSTLYRVVERKLFLLAYIIICYLLTATFCFFSSQFSPIAEVFFVILTGASTTPIYRKYRDEV